MNYNKVILVGNLTKDPELKSMPKGGSVTSFSIATNRSWVDQGNQKHEEVQFHNIVAFGKMAELICQYMKKGGQILVDGRIQNRSWESNGEKKYRTEIIIETFQFGSKGKDSSSAAAPNVGSMPTTQSPIPELTNDDIPF